MTNKCNCLDHNKYVGDEAKEFYASRQWHISHLKNIQILRCPECGCLWETTYPNGKEEFIIQKKVANPLSLKGRTISFWLGEVDLNVTFPETEFLRIFEDDQRAIIKIRDTLEFNGKKAKYFFIKKRHDGFLSDLVTIDKTTSVNAGYLINENKDVESLTEDDFKFEWIGSITLEEKRS